MSRIGVIRSALPLAIFLGTGSANAANTTALCERFRDSLRITRLGMATSDLKAPQWEPLTVDIGNYHIGNMQLKVELEGTLIDIENRGIPDRVLLKDQMMVGTDLYNDLYVLRVDPFGTRTKIRVQSFGEISNNGMAVELYGYYGAFSRRYGITIPSLSLVSIEHTTYVMIQQNAIMKTPPLVLLAKYTGKPDRKHVNSQAHHPQTSNLHVVCAVHAL